MNSFYWNFYLLERIAGKSCSSWNKSFAFFSRHSWSHEKLFPRKPMCSLKIVRSGKLIVNFQLMMWVKNYKALNFKCKEIWQGKAFWNFFIHFDINWKSSKSTEVFEPLNSWNRRDVLINSSRLNIKYWKSWRKWKQFLPFCIKD